VKQQDALEPCRRLAWPPADSLDSEALATREWLVTNGLGGYASGTVSGVITRRYHGLLVAALPSPFGRVMMLNQLREQVIWPGGRRASLWDEASPAQAVGRLVEFRLERGLPVWTYEVGGLTIEKRVFMPYMQNTAIVLYDIVKGEDTVEIELRISVNFRPQEAPVSEPLGSPYEVRAAADQYEVALKGSELPPLRLFVWAESCVFVLDGECTTNVLYPVEESRGYQPRGDLWSPGYYRLRISKGSAAALGASTEEFEILTALEPRDALAAERIRRRRLIARAAPEVRAGRASELVLAADQFVVTPAGRAEEAARAHAFGDEVRTVIAGYHWFTDWGRDTMISLEGLTLVTGRHAEAGFILRTFGQYIRNGLLPNLFPEGRKEGLYHTADATLWFFHAIDRYLQWTGEDATLAGLYPKLVGIVDAHNRGTDFGIHVDPADGLLTQGAPGYQLTWMDAKVDDWVVTPRRGKAVEINALWYNALCLMEGWARQMDDGRADEYASLGARVRRSFNERFWNDERQYLFDVVESAEGGNEAKLRPNQLFAIALPHPVLDHSRWAAVVHAVREHLLTPVGLRSLGPDDPDFKERYYGDLRARDAAYHQGTVWAWLVGPFVDAWLKTFPGDVTGAQAVIEGLMTHLDDACVGSVSEVFDANEPFTPRGCIAQAWSVAELLRVWVRLAQERRRAVPAARSSSAL
jgi:predicted glycogen debranching enzyme